MNKKQLQGWLDVLNYWLDHVEDYGTRYPDMKYMVEKFDHMIDEIYNIYKGLPDEQI